MESVVKNIHEKPTREGLVHDYITSADLKGVSRPVSFDPDELGEEKVKILAGMGEIIPKPEGMETNPYPRQDVEE